MKIKSMKLKSCLKKKSFELSKNSLHNDQKIFPEQSNDTTQQNKSSLKSFESISSFSGNQNH